jgi:hypothetical protein
MPFQKRFYVSKLEACQTLYYDGCETARYDGWNDTPVGMWTARTEAKAQRRADRVGGEVYATTVMVSLSDGFKAPVIQVSARAA